MAPLRQSMVCPFFCVRGQREFQVPIQILAPFCVPLSGFSCRRCFCYFCYPLYMTPRMLIPFRVQCPLLLLSSPSMSCAIRRFEESAHIVVVSSLCTERQLNRIAKIQKKETPNHPVRHSFCNRVDWDFLLVRSTYFLELHWVYLTLYFTWHWLNEFVPLFFLPSIDDNSAPSALDK